MAKEFRVIGPPGSGKTTTVKRRVERWIEARDYEARDIQLASFTRAAAVELAGRIELPDGNATTLHALAWRSLGNPPLAEVPPLSTEWNEKHAKTSRWRVGETVRETDGLTMPDKDEGDMLRRYSLLRQRLAPASDPDWDLTAPFAREWEAWKAHNDAVDWTDILEHALINWDGLPGNQPVFIVDEAQDLTPLQWRLVREWGESCDVFMVVGDGAQCLYAFAGADPAEFMTPLPEGQEYTLPRSYRMPQLVQERAEALLRNHRGVDLSRTYAPRDEAGKVERSRVTWRDGEHIARLADSGRETMVIAQAAYMLAPTLAGLRARGVPFHNPYRRSNGAWNPLHAQQRGDRQAVTTLSRVQAFMSGEVKLWPAMVGATMFQMRGGKKRLEEEPTVEQLRGWAKPEMVAAWEARDLDWLVAHCGKQYRYPLEYASALLKRGLDPAREPKVKVGTIHSVKGGEADVVIAIPDLSWAAIEEQVAKGQPARDAAVRLGYVALSRAREELVLCSPISERSLW